MRTLVPSPFHAMSSTLPPRPRETGVVVATLQARHPRLQPERGGELLTVTRLVTGGGGAKALRAGDGACS